MGVGVENSPKAANCRVFEAGTHLLFISCLNLDFLDERIYMRGKEERMNSLLPRSDETFFTLRIEGKS